MMVQKVAAVTGSRRGIGRAIAEELAREGYFILLSGVTPLDEGVEALDALRGAGYQADYLCCDISQPADREAFFRAIRERYGRLDVMVNNAGVAPTVRMDLLETTVESFERLLRVNLEGTFFMCQQAANLMIALQKQGLPDYTPRMVNLSSISSFTSSVNRGEYCVSKAGISMVTKLFADKLAAYGIPVFEVQPGIILTDMTAGVREKYERLIAEGVTPIRRMGQPKDVADCVVAAVSGRLDFATGQVLYPDGGFRLQRL